MTRGNAGQSAAGSRGGFDVVGTGVDEMKCAREKNESGGGRGARAHHRPLGVFREDRIVRDVSNEVLADEVRGGSSAVAVEDAVERQGIVRTPGHLQPLHPAAGVLHGSPATHLAVLSAAQRRLRGLVRWNGGERNVDDAVSRRGTSAGRGDKGARGFQNAFAPSPPRGGGGNELSRFARAGTGRNATLRRAPSRILTRR